MIRIYSEGSTFLIPLQSGGVARGIVARMAPKGIVLFGYFFGPRLPTNEIANFEDLQTNDAVLATHFSDMGLVKKVWPVLGTMPGWERSQWPIPDLLSRDPNGDLKPMLIRYDDNNPEEVISQRYVDVDEGQPDDGFAGAGYIQRKLDKLLA